MAGSPVPGSLTALLGAAAAPEAFMLQRWAASARAPAAPRGRPALQHLGPLVGPDAHRRPLLHRHKPCGHLFDPVMVCSECREPLKAREVIVEPGFRSEGGELDVVPEAKPLSSKARARPPKPASPG